MDMIVSVPEEKEEKGVKVFALARDGDPGCSTKCFGCDDYMSPAAGVSGQDSALPQFLTMCLSCVICLRVQGEVLDHIQLHVSAPQAHHSRHGEEVRF